MVPTQPQKSLGLSTQVLIGLILGLAAGVFLGETLTFLQAVGPGLIALLPMTVLPYIPHPIGFSGGPPYLRC